MTRTYDVAIVGFGPVGQTLALMLGRAHHSVIVLEKRVRPYELPRACHLDHEAMRIFQRVDLADDVREVCVPARDYQLLSGDGSLLASLPRSWSTPSGWEPSYHFHQPDLETRLVDAVTDVPAVEVRRGARVAATTDEGDHVRLLVDGPAGTATVRARYVIGADGANSTVREHAGIELNDLGFAATWVVADVQMRDGHPLPDIPDTGQICDPAQPMHMAWLGGPHLRWELMLAHGEDPETATTPGFVWPRLRRWVTPNDAQLLRGTTYTFRSLVARRFRSGRMVLAGDAAHVMPPFLGQGLVSGLRDAATLAWILERVLAGRSPQALLDTYTADRHDHVTAYVRESIRIGRVVCETDPAKARVRDAALRSDRAISTPFQPPLGGVTDGDHPALGRLAMQPRIQTPGGSRLLDDLLGPGFRLLATEPRVPADLAPATRSTLNRLGVEVVLIRPGAGEVECLSHLAADHVLLEDGDRFGVWLAQQGLEAVLVRPDGYVHGITAVGDRLDASVDALADHLDAGVRAAGAHA